MSNALRYTAIGLAGGATVLLVLCQFLPLQSADEEEATFSSSLWNWKVEAGPFDQDDGWGDWPGNDDGTGLIQTGGWILTAGLVAAAAAAVTLAVNQRNLGMAFAFGATVLVLTGFVLWMVGFGNLEGGDIADESDPTFSFYLAIVSMACLGAAGVLALVDKPGTGTSSKTGGVDF
jgi:hypothetical protein